MSILLKVTLDCNMHCAYCYQKDTRSLGKHRYYDIDAILATAKKLWEETGDTPSLHGGECLLVAKPDLERLLAGIYQMSGQSGIQTNASLIDDEHIRMFKKYRTHVGASIDGPWPLNRGRANEDMTAKILANIAKLRAADISVGPIIVLSRFNATRDKRPALKDFLVTLRGMGIKGGRLNFVECGNPEIELSAEEAKECYLDLADFILREPGYDYQPFRDIVDNLCGFGLGTCLLPGTFVWTGNGLDCVERANDTIVGANGRIQNIVHKWNKQYDGTAVEITIRGWNIPLKLTEEHKALVVPADRYRWADGQLKEHWKHKGRERISKKEDLSFLKDRTWVEAREVKKNDLLLVPKPQYELCTPPFSEAVAELLGWYAAEGSHDADHRVRFVVHEKEVAHLVELIERAGAGQHVSIQYRPNSKAACVNINNREWTQLFMERVPGKVHSKHLSGTLKRMPKSYMAKFLKGYMDGDGYIGFTYTGVNTVSERLALDIVDMLLCCGFWPKLYRQHPKGKRPVYCVGVNTKQRDALCRFMDTTNPCKPTKGQQHFFEDDDFFYVPVREVKLFPYSGPVYDLQTDDHTITTPAIVHNCIFTKCDFYATQAGKAILGDGSVVSCLKTAKDGQPFLQAEKPNTVRYEILKAIPREKGGCGGCRFWRICFGGCCAEGENDDWRNKTRYCEAFHAIYELIETRLKALLPNIELVTDKPEPATPEEEERDYEERRCNRYSGRPFALMTPEGTGVPSTWRGEARSNAKGTGQGGRQGLCDRQAVPGKPGWRHGDHYDATGTSGQGGMRSDPRRQNVGHGDRAHGDYSRHGDSG